MPRAIPAWLYMDAHPRHAQTPTSRSVVKVRKWKLRKVHSFQVGSSFRGPAAASLLPLRLLTPREGKQLGKDTFTHILMCTILKVRNQPRSPELRKLEGGRTSEII